MKFLEFVEFSIDRWC